MTTGHTTEEMELEGHRYMRAEGKDHMSEQKKSLDMRAEGKDHMSEPKALKSG